MDSIRIFTCIFLVEGKGQGQKKERERGGEKECEIVRGGGEERDKERDNTEYHLRRIKIYPKFLFRQLRVTE